MGIKVAINGYGRIGRQVLRAIYDYKLQDQFEVVAVNASGSLETNAHLTKFDTVHGRFDADISHDATHLIINGRKIPFFSTRNPAELPWRDLDVDLVMECTGSFTSKSKANAHLESGAKKVLISAPCEADVDATIVYGVNDDIITDDMTVISNASCTTNCLAPIAKVLHEDVGIVKGAMTTIHALTNDQIERQTRRPRHPRADRQCFCGRFELPSRARHHRRRNQRPDAGRFRGRPSERHFVLQHPAAGLHGLQPHHPSQHL